MKQQDPDIETFIIFCENKNNIMAKYKLLSQYTTIC